MLWSVILLLALSAVLASVDKRLAMPDRPAEDLGALEAETGASEVMRSNPLLGPPELAFRRGYAATGA